MSVAQEIRSPVLLRASCALAFGVFEVFIPESPQVVRGVLAAFFFASTGASCWYLLRKIGPKNNDQDSGEQWGEWSALKPWLWVEAIGLPIAALIILLNNSWLIPAIHGGLLLMGLVELSMGLKNRVMLRQDWLISGTVAILGAVLVLLIGFDNPRAPLGVLAVVAIIQGVLWLISGLSLPRMRRHEAGS